MTPDQTAAAEAVTAEVKAYSDQLVPGAAEAIGRLWAPLAKMPPEQRAQEVAKRMASPLVARWRDPGYDPEAAPTPLERAIGQQAHKLRDGAAAELATAWSAELAGRDPTRLAGEVARRLADPANVGFLKDQPADRPYVARLDKLLWDNFSDVLDPARVKDLIRDRGQQFARMSDQQVIMMVAGSLGSAAVREKYGKGLALEPGDLRLRGASKETIMGTRTVRTAQPAPATLPSAPARDQGGRFAPTTPAAPRRRSSF